MSKKMDWSNKKEVIQALTLDGMLLSEAPDEIKDDKESVMAALEQSGLVLGVEGANIEFASDRLKADKEVVMKAVKETPSALHHVDDSLKKDKDVVSIAVLGRSGGLSHADDSLKADKDFFMDLMNRSTEFENLTGYSFNCLHESLRGDKEVVMAVVSVSGSQLENASDSLRADKEVVLAALENDSSALEYASQALKADKELVMANLCLWAADDSLKADKEVVMAAVKEYAGNLQDASKALKADKEVVMAAVQKDGSSLKYADDSLKADKDIVLMALHTQYKSYGDTENVFEFVDKSLRRDADVKKARAGGEVTRNKEMVFEGEGGEYQLNIHTSTEAKEYMKDIESSNPLDHFDGSQGGNVSAFYGIELGELETQFPKAEIELIADNKNFSSPIPPSKGKHIEELYVTKGEVYSEGFVVQIDAEEEFEEEKLTFQYSIACFAIAHHVNEIAIVHNVLYDGKEIDGFCFSDSGSEVTVTLVGYDKEDNQAVFYDSRYMDKVDWKKMSDLLDY
jgi:hypothetical protein